MYLYQKKCHLREGQNNLTATLKYLLTKQRRYDKSIKNYQKQQRLAPEPKLCDGALRPEWTAKVDLQII